MKKTFVAKIALAGTLGVVAAMAAGSANAAICSACHTMHNSQDGIPMRGATTPQPLPKLLLNDCIGCHTGTNTATSLTTQQPEVYTPGAAAVYGGVGNNTLAGGNFYWAATAGTENTGHNVAELLTVDPDLGNTPPGHTVALGQQLTCAGVYGCHGERTAGNEVPLESLHGSHHYPHNTVADALAHTAVGNSFRYLFGVDGLEDSDWEFANSNAVHNIYKGEDRTGAVETAAADATTISSLCGQCHGAYHREANDAYGIVEDTTGPGNDIIGTGQWIRHPTDYGMPAAGEYAGYAAYRIETPVGTDTLDGAYDVVNTPGDRIVLCVSCHRAHGSPYADALRWNYALMETGNGGAAAGTGCFACHTAKD